MIRFFEFNLVAGLFCYPRGPLNWLYRPYPIRWRQQGVTVVSHLKADNYIGGGDKNLSLADKLISWKKGSEGCKLNIKKISTFSRKLIRFAWQTDHFRIPLTIIDWWLTLISQQIKNGGKAKKESIRGTYAVEDNDSADCKLVSTIESIVLFYLCF